MTFRFVIDGAEVPLTRGDLEVAIEVDDAVAIGQRCTSSSECGTGLACVALPEPLRALCAHRRAVHARRLL